MEGELDLEPSAPGVQHECVVSEMTRYGQADQQEKLLAECSGPSPPETERPCWRFEHDPSSCGHTPTQLSLIVDRPSRTTIAPGTHILARCAASACVDISN